MIRIQDRGQRPRPSGRTQDEIQPPAGKLEYITNVARSILLQTTLNGAVGLYGKDCKVE